MRQKEINEVERVIYNGRSVEKSSFRAFVYREGMSKLAGSWNEYEKLIASGEWFNSIAEIPKPVIEEAKQIRKPRMPKEKEFGEIDEITTDKLLSSCVDAE